MTLNSTNYGHLLSKETHINHLLFLDDLKLYGKTERELHSLVDPVGIILKDVGMEFRMEKCSTVRIKKGKVCDMENVEMLDGQHMKQIEESGYKYLGIIQDSEIKTQVNQWALNKVRYNARIVDWNRGDLEGRKKVP